MYISQSDVRPTNLRTLRYTSSVPLELRSTLKFPPPTYLSPRTAVASLHAPEETHLKTVSAFACRASELRGTGTGAELGLLDLRPRSRTARRNAHLYRVRSLAYLSTIYCSGRPCLPHAKRAPGPPPGQLVPQSTLTSHPRRAPSQRRAPSVAALLRMQALVRCRRRSRTS